MAEQAVRDRLDDLIRRSGEDYASLSRLMGRNPAYIQQYIKRGVPRRLNEVDRRLLARHFNVPESFLGAPDPDCDPGGEARAPALLRAASAVHACIEAAVEDPEASAPDDADCLLIPFLEARVAGAPSGTPAAPGLALAVSAARQMAAERITDLRAMRVASDSMLPTLAAGDEILIDCADRIRLRDGIYCIMSEGVPMVKRLSVHPVTKRLSVISDNPAYPSFADCQPELVEIVGRVVWVGRRLA